VAGQHGAHVLDAQVTLDHRFDQVAGATKNEGDSKKNAKENGTDNKTLQGYLLQGKIETQNKVKEVLDKDKGKLYDEAVKASQPDKKKKK